MSASEKISYWLFNQYLSAAHFALGAAEAGISQRQRIEVASLIPHGWRIVRHSETEFAFSRFTSFSCQYAALMSFLVNAESVVRHKSSRKADTLYALMTSAIQCSEDGKSRAALIYDLLRDHLGSASVVTYSGFESSERVLDGPVDVEGEDKARLVLAALTRHRANPETYVDHELLNVHAHTLTPTFSLLTSDGIEHAVSVVNATGYPNQAFTAPASMRAQSRAYLAYYLSLAVLRTLCKLLVESCGDASAFIAAWRTRCNSIADCSYLNAGNDVTRIFEMHEKDYAQIACSGSAAQEAERILSTGFLLLRSIQSAYSQWASAWDDIGFSCLYPLTRHFTSAQYDDPYSVASIKKYLLYLLDADSKMDGAHDQMIETTRTLLLGSNAFTSSGFPMPDSVLLRSGDTEESDDFSETASRHLAALSTAVLQRDTAMAYDHAAWVFSRISPEFSRRVNVLPMHNVLSRDNVFADAITHAIGADKGYANSMLLAYFGNASRALAYVDVGASENRSQFDYLLAPDSFWGEDAFDRKTKEDLSLL